jgi:hypothetical protein
MGRIVSYLVAAMIMMFIGGCGDDNGETEDLPIWKGAVEHFELKGTINGTAIDINVSGEDAKDTEILRADMEYKVPDVDDKNTYKDGYFYSLEVKVYGEAVTNVLPETSRFEIELKGEDLQNPPSGSKINIIPQDLQKKREIFETTNTMWCEVELRNMAEDKYYEQPAEAGTLVTGAFTGEVSDDGLTAVEQSGTIGGAFKARWSPTEELECSFTSNIRSVSVDPSPW